MPDDDEKAEHKTAATAKLLTDAGAHGRLLVIGCGDGSEANYLARHLDLDVVGIDVEDEFVAGEPDGRPAAHLVMMDARSLDFADDSFDGIYSFHALEHIPQPELALAEMRRVLKADGYFLIGTPNKERLVGYINSAAPLKSRLQWNVADWKMRLRGQWSNEQGAHAGFTGADLLAMCRRTFGAAQDATGAYYLELYSSRRELVRTLIRARLGPRLFPAVYIASPAPAAGATPRA